MIQKCRIIIILIIFFTDLCKANVDNTDENDANRTTIERKGQMAKEGSLVRLKCQTKHPWFFCLWKSPRDERQCALNFQGAQLESKCKNDRLLLQGSENLCNLEMKASPSDHGAWMCFVISKSFGTAKSYVDLEVAVEATLVMQFDGGGKQRDGNEETNPGINDTKDDDEAVLHIDDTKDDDEAVLHIDDGEEKLVTCSARRAFPESRISWTLNNSTSSDLDDSSQAFTKEYKDDHLLDTTQTIKITGRMEYDNSSLVCWSRQIRETGNVVFVKSSSITINVHAIAVPLSLNLGPLLLMLLFLLFLIFLCIIFSLFWKWKWNKDEKKKQIEKNAFPTKVAGRGKSYDQNMNTLSIKRELYRHNIFQDDEFQYRGYHDINRYPSVIVSEPKASVRAITEKDLELHLTPCILTSNLPSSLESQRSSSNGSFSHKFETDDEFGKSASKLSLIPPNSASKLSLIASNSASKLSAPSLSARAVNTIISNNTNDDLDNITVTTTSDLNEMDEAARNENDIAEHGIENPAFSPLEFPDIRDSVFYCEEGCFDLMSPCTHIRVAII